MANDVGQQLGNYRLVRLLGRGGFADVYLGEHLYLNTPAAIKLLQIQPTDEVLAKFLTEARTIARLSHPHIVSVLDFGIEQGTPFLVMAYAPYGSLRQRHAPGSILPAATIISYCRQIALALQYAHDRNIIHRDVKPENMLLGKDQTLMLADFGIALSAAGTTSVMGTHLTLNPLNVRGQDGHTSTRVVGTATYMAPEQFNGKPSPLSDQYALGIAVYEWFCGVPPFQGTDLGVAIQHMQTPPSSMREKVPTLAPTIEQVVMQVLAKEPERRFARVQDFAEALEEACKSAPVLSLPVKLPLSPSSLAVSSGEQAAKLPPGWHSSPTIMNTSANLPGLGGSGSGTLPTPGGEMPAGRLSLSAPHPSLPLITRRRAIIGLAGLTAGVAIASGGVALFELTHNHPGTSAQTRRPAIVRKPPTPVPTSPALVSSASTRPALTSWRAGQLDMFLRGADNALWRASYDGGWQAWESLGGSLSYDPVATSWGSGRFDLCVRGADNSPQYTWFDGSWHLWESLGGVLTSDPALTSWGVGRLDLFARSLDSGLWHKWYDGAWHDWESLGGVIVSNPTAVSWQIGQIYAFARGADNNLWYRLFDGSWQAWQSLGSLSGGFVSDPTVASWSVGRLDVFVRGPDNTLQHIWFDGTWHPWESLGGALSASPTAISWGTNRIDVFGRGANNALQYIWYDGSWHAWAVMK